MQNQRRSFLKILAATPLVACGSSGKAADFGVVAAGTVGETSVGKLVVVAHAPAILARDKDGLYAMTITCTHEGCDVTPSGAALLCACHGSLFDANGNVQKGPAQSPLVHFKVLLDAAGNISVDGKTQVPASERTAVA